eukprot:CAMPEP_0202444156 /NCGR_PEP_ID=MMETSP1360-20130828/3302_1 /ASSEMBLY_ACC=CAM_ASM_000848 /TAXON_ID=515479 /ORGANISM="Licmophora paradoxa, Strain CCMP2313" /LENGTH=204 /DNA_ID=CAMNT_0049060077 /DNA_START=274 /DNA_END=888 /DNA_ORIENTATION=-
MRGVQITQQDQLHVELGRTNANRLTASELTAMSRGDRRPVTQLALKTRIYRRRLETEAFSPYGQTERNNDDEVSCAICFAQIEEGERVGSLSCDHIFHSHCLKSWLKRRNICPLCQISNVAKPIYGGEEEDDSESKDDEQGERRDPYYESELDGDLVETGRRLSGDGFFVGHLSSSGVESRQDQDGLFSEDPGTHHNSSDNGVV